ncbi:hypothetical protein BN2537_17201 [Streptomyces venezuelae]|nr:hypothetical protein BN2537_17201 [Streptomyces venezuelae]
MRTSRGTQFVTLEQHAGSMAGRGSVGVDVRAGNSRFASTQSLLGSQLVTP